MTLIVPVFNPIDLGANVAFMVQFAPGATRLPQVELVPNWPCTFSAAVPTEIQGGQSAVSGKEADSSCLASLARRNDKTRVAFALIVFHDHPLPLS